MAKREVGGAQGGTASGLCAYGMSFGGGEIGESATVDGFLDPVNQNGLLGFESDVDSVENRE